MNRVCPIALALLLAAGMAGAPASAQMFKWTDERGVTHYSDRKPDQPVPVKVEPVAGRVSVYSTDPSLLQAVEEDRVYRTRQSGAPSSQNPVPNVSTASPQPVPYPPCAYGDCGIVSGVEYPVGEHVPYRHRPRLRQAVLPPGAIAGTINSNGAIPGNTAGMGNVAPETFTAGSRMRPMPTRQAPLEPQRR